MGGGNGIKASTAAAAAGLSPRGRGKPTDEAGLAQSSRSIPAWAGETRIRGACPDIRMVYPRVGGGNVAVIAARLRREGLSPRGRGKRTLWRDGGRDVRSIPAWAGETYSR